MGSELMICRLADRCARRGRRLMTVRVRESPFSLTREIGRCDALWALDGAQVGREADGASQHVELGRELRSLGYLPAVVGGPQCGDDVVSALEAGRQARRCLPLVVATDNGSKT